MLMDFLSTSCSRISNRREQKLQMWFTALKNLPGEEHVWRCSEVVFKRERRNAERDPATKMVPYKFLTEEGNGETSMKYLRRSTQWKKIFVHFQTNCKHTLHKKGTVNRLCNTDVR